MQVIWEFLERNALVNLSKTITSRISKSSYGWENRRISHKDIFLIWLRRGITQSVLLLGLSCGATNYGPLSEPKAYVSMRSRWPSKLIEVCWERGSERFSQQKVWVRQRVEREFEGKTSLRFVGWQRCEANAKGIRIGISDERGSVPHTKGLGRELGGVSFGMVLNFTFQNWAGSCLTNVRKCIESIAVHEFGHAVGMAHEQNRSDAPATCLNFKQGADGDQAIGDWDLQSVMNYCNPVYNNGGYLSKGDIRGIELLYGR